MQLREWLFKERMTQTALSEKLDVTNRIVSRWICGDRKPAASRIVEIHNLTEGEVTFADWYGDQLLH